MAARKSWIGSRARTLAAQHWYDVVEYEHQPPKWRRGFMSREQFVRMFLADQKARQLIKRFRRAMNEDRQGEADAVP